MGANLTISNPALNLVFQNRLLLVSGSVSLPSIRSFLQCPPCALLAFKINSETQIQLWHVPSVTTWFRNHVYHQKLFRNAQTFYIHVLQVPMNNSAVAQNVEVPGAQLADKDPKREKFARQDARVAMTWRQNMQQRAQWYGDSHELIYNCSITHTRLSIALRWLEKNDCQGPGLFWFWQKWLTLLGIVPALWVASFLFFFAVVMNSNLKNMATWSFFWWQQVLIPLNFGF